MPQGQSAKGPNTNAVGSAAPPKPFGQRLGFRVLAFLVVLYVAWCTTLYFFQDKLLFPVDLAPDPLPALYDATTDQITIDTGDGRSVAWFIPTWRLAPEKPAPVVIFFHGNAEIIDYQSTIIEGYRKLGLSVFLPEYRGYGRSDGEPSERAIVADAVRFYDELVQRPNVDGSRIVIHGRSLGGGPAAQLAARRESRGLVLESTFSSAAAMAHKYFVPMFLAKNPFRTDRVLVDLDAPVLIFHGTHDDIIPVAHGRRLRDIAEGATYIEYNCRHNDFPGPGREAEYWARIAGFLKHCGVLSEN